MATNNPAMPLYLQIASSLIEQIKMGELSPGSRLPSERTLSEQLSVSRMTVRQALAVLHDQGMIERRAGEGSFVSEKKYEQPVDILIGFSAEMNRKGLNPGAKMLVFELQAANKQVAHFLNIKLGQQVYFIYRLRLANNLPMALEYSFFPASEFPSLDKYDLENNSIYAILASEYGVTLKRAHQALEPTIARGNEAELLGVETGSPLMLIERTSFSQDDIPVEYSKDLYRGDRFRFVSTSLPTGW